MEKQVTMSRREYEAVEIEKLVVGLGKAPEEAAGEINSWYPTGTQEAQRELQTRGLNATDWRVEAYAENRRRSGHPLRIAGKSRLWERQDIDDLATQLEGDHNLTRDALYREGAGVTWAEERRLQERGRLEREKDLTERIGVSLFELRVALYGWGMDSEVGFLEWIKRDVDSPEIDFSPVWHYWTEGHVEKARAFIDGLRSDPSFAEQVERYRQIERRLRKYRRRVAAEKP